MNSAAASSSTPIAPNFCEIVITSSIDSACQQSRYTQKIIASASSITATPAGAGSARRGLGPLSIATPTPIATAIAANAISANWLGDGVLERARDR